MTAKEEFSLARCLLDAWCAGSFATVLCLFWGPTLYGQGVVPIGGEFQVNSYTIGSQNHPAVSALPDGGLVVVWRGGRSAGTDSSWSSIQGRFLAADGTPKGEDFQVNTYTEQSQLAPRVAALVSGGFVVTWYSFGSSGTDSSGASVQGQRFAADGMPEGGEFQVNTYTHRNQRGPAVAGLAEGGFVVVWSSSGSSGTDSYSSSIQGQRFASDGVPEGGEFQVNTYTTESQGEPAVAGLADGGFKVVWRDAGSGGTDAWLESIQGRRYTRDGVAAAGQFQINSYTTSHQEQPTLAALPDGGTVVMWRSNGSSGTDSSGASVQGQRFAFDGTPLGGEFQVNSYTAHSQEYASAAASADGGFVAVWQDSEAIGLGHFLQSIQGQRFAPDGQRLGGEFQLTSQIVDYQEYPAVAALPDGGLIAVWQSVTSSGTDTQGFSIQGSHYSGPRFALVGPGGKCLDVEGGRRDGGAQVESVSDGTPVNLYRCHGGENQRWRFDLTSVPQTVSGLDGKCLVPGSVETSGDIQVVIGPCGGPEALWQLAAPGHAELSVLIHGSTGLCLDVEGAAGRDGTPTQLFECHGGGNQLWRPAAEICTRDSLGLCLGRERFRVDLEWRSFDGTTGSGTAVPVGSDDSGLLWFFEGDNWEMLIKVLDGCAINDRFWVFAAATTTVEYTLTVTDTALGTVAEYVNPLGNAAAAITDTDAFATCSAAAGNAGRPPAVEAMFRLPPSGKTIPAGFVADEALAPEGACLSSRIQMCLSNDRFSVEVDWRDHAGNVGSGRVVGTNSPDSGLFWFFNSTNWEVLIKVLDACHLEDPRFLMLAAATTDVEYTLRVTDTQTGDEWQYFNPLGNVAAALVDTFETCP